MECKFSLEIAYIDLDEHDYMEGFLDEGEFTQSLYKHGIF